MGAMALYISDQSVVNFQPMNVNFGLIPPLGYRDQGQAQQERRAVQAGAGGAGGAGALLTGDGTA